MTSIYLPQGYWTALSAARAEAASLRAELTCLRNAYRELAQVQPSGTLPTAAPSGDSWRGTPIDFSC